MAQTLMLGWASVAPDSAPEDFHRWYEETHIPQVSKALSVTGEVKRFELVGADGQPRFLAIYDLGESSPAEAATALDAAAKAGELDMTDAMDLVVHPPELQFVTGL